MEEKVFYDDGFNKVTNARFITGGQTYALAGLTSVKMTESPFQYKLHLYVVGAILILAGMGNFSHSVSNGIVLLAMGIAAIWLAYNAKSTYNIVTVSAGGEVKALSSKNIGVISGIVNAINDAIVHRG